MLWVKYSILINVKTYNDLTYFLAQVSCKDHHGPLVLKSMGIIMWYP